jgi:hypothetical protein
MENEILMETTMIDINKLRDNVVMFVETPRTLTAYIKACDILYQIYPTVSLKPIEDYSSIKKGTIKLVDLEKTIELLGEGLDSLNNDYLDNNEIPFKHIRKNSSFRYHEGSWIVTYTKKDNKTGQHSSGTFRNFKPNDKCLVASKHYFYPITSIVLTFFGRVEVINKKENFISLGGLGTNMERDTYIYPPALYLLFKQNPGLLEYKEELVQS